MGGWLVGVGGYQPIIWPKFPENCMKVQKIGPEGRVQNFIKYINY